MLDGYDITLWIAGDYLFLTTIGHGKRLYWIDIFDEITVQKVRSKEEGRKMIDANPQLWREK